MRAFLALPRIEQNELLNPLQLFDELFHGKIAPGGFGLAMHILQHRDAQHAVKGVDADLAVGPVMHRSPTEPLSVFQAAEDALHLLLADRKSTRLNSSHGYISYAVFCLKKKTKSGIHSLA